MFYHIHDYKVQQEIVHHRLCIGYIGTNYKVNIIKINICACLYFFSLLMTKSEAARLCKATNNLFNA